MNTVLRQILFLLLGSAILFAQSGCVRSSTYKKTRNALDDVRILYHSEQQRGGELKARNKQLVQQLTELATTAEMWRKQAVRAEQESQQIRTELHQLQSEREAR
jgi:hypothetical protein